VADFGTVVVLVVWVYVCTHVYVLWAGLDQQDEFEMQADAIAPGQTVVVVDDILATGAHSFVRSITPHHTKP
jgi:adenine/guanine phosphoribosyltransferase-like PRPP-binding protein